MLRQNVSERSRYRLQSAYVYIVVDILFTSPLSDARRLTHLNLDFRGPISDAEVYILARALQSYPMEVLVLDGILGGYPPVIEDKVITPWSMNIRTAWCSHRRATSRMTMKRQDMYCTELQCSRPAAGRQS